jgi:hypothetical protein
MAFFFLIYNMQFSCVVKKKEHLKSSVTEALLFCLIVALSMSGAVIYFPTIGGSSLPSRHVELS